MLKSTLRFCWKCAWVSPARKLTQGVWRHQQPLNCDIAKERLFLYQKTEFVNSQNISQIFKIQNNILRYQNSVLWYQTKQKRICFITIRLTYSSRIYDVIVNSVDRPDSSPIRVCTVCSGLSVKRLGIIRYLSVCLCLSVYSYLSFCL